jgi:hypothetical protein
VPATTGRRLLTAREVLGMTGWSPRHLHNLMGRGECPEAINPGARGQRWWRVEDVERALLGRPAPAGQPGQPSPRPVGGGRRKQSS